MDERWNPVVGYEGLYEVSDLGRVRRIAADVTMPSRWGGALTRHIPAKVLTPIRREKCMVVALSHGTARATRVHRVVLAAFVGPCPPGLEVCHNNGDFSDNRLANLRYDTHSSNMKDAIRHGTFRGQVGPRSKISASDAADIRTRYASGESTRALTAAFGVTKSHIYKIIRGEVWTN